MNTSLTQFDGVSRERTDFPNHQFVMTIYFQCDYVAITKQSHLSQPDFSCDLNRSLVIQFWASFPLPKMLNIALIFSGFGCYPIVHKAS